MDYSDHSERPDLDAVFYRRFYPDVAMLSDALIEAHWRQHGNFEGRFASWTHFIDAEPGFARAIPADFSVYGYRLRNPDLISLVADWEFVRHYVDFGRQEGREYAIEPGSFIAEAYFDGVRPDTAALEMLASKGGDWNEIAPDMETLLARNGITSSALLSVFDANFYRLRVPALADGLPARMIRHFVEAGRAALAPIAADHDFDPQFYAEIDPASGGLVPADAYLRWLNDGLAFGLPPNARVFLGRLGLSDLSAMPEGFDPDIYRAGNDDLAALSRWDALRHAIVHGIPEGRPGCALNEASLGLHLASANRLAETGADRSASEIFSRVLLVDPENTVALRHLADTLLRQERWVDAARCYRETIRLGRDNVWSHLHLATCYERIGEATLARDVLVALAASRPWDERGRNLAADVAVRSFDIARDAAGALASRGRFGEGRDAMHRAVSALIANHPRMCKQVVRARAGVGQIRAVAILAELSLPQCRFYRVEQKVQQLERAGIKATMFDRDTECAAFIAAIPFVDAAIFYRVPALPEIVAAIAAARNAGLPTFYDIDDPIFDDTIFPDTIESYGGLVDRAEYGSLVTGTALYRAAAAACEFGIASTPTLAALLEPVVASGVVHVHRNAIGRSHLAVVPAGPRKSGPIRIFYGSGTRGQNEDFTDHAAPAFARLLDKHGDAVELVIMGHLALPDILTSRSARIRRLAPCWDTAAYWRILSSADINISVSKPGLLGDCKSEIKWLEAAIFAIPTIATSTATHRDIIRSGETGVLVTTPDEWFVALDALVRDAPGRRAIGQAARETALEDYGIARASEGLRNILDPLPAAGTKAAFPKTKRMRVLVVNVFYPPQAIGGATRVVADNIRDMIERHGDTLDFEVLTTTDGGTTPYETRVSIVDGVRVTAITASDDADVDRRANDPRMARIFERVLDQVRPDLVHFHCIQRLGASLCGVAASRAIPYVITLHDGWWVSDHQFLLDADGRLDHYDYVDPVRDAQVSPSRDARACANSGHARASRLLPHLLGAECLIAVSEPFADLHRNAGLPGVVTIANGLPAVRPHPRTAPPEGVVRLAYLGGCCLHKGYDLLRAAFTGARFENIRLTVIDHALEPGIERFDVWGATRVRFSGKLPQSEIGALYARTDIVVAPSIWPESFGLVTREAVAHGCRVIASDRGAIAGDVTPATGMVVDVTSLDGLTAALARVNRDPQTYATGASAGDGIGVQTVRRSVEQADELACLYAAIRKGRSSDIPGLRARVGAAGLVAANTCDPTNTHALAQTDGESRARRTRDVARVN